MNLRIFERIPFKQEKTEQGAQSQTYRKSIIEGNSTVRGEIGPQMLTQYGQDTVEICHRSA